MHSFYVHIACDFRTNCQTWAKCDDR